MNRGDEGTERRDDRTTRRDRGDERPRQSDGESSDGLGVRRRAAESVRVAAAVLAVAREEHLSVTAAGLAYYMFISAIPLFLLAFVGLTFFEAHAVLVGAIRDTLGEEVARFFERSVEADAARIRATIIAAVLLLWSALRMFESLHRIFADLYDVRKRASAVDRAGTVALGFVVVTLALALLAALGVGLTFVLRSEAWDFLGPFLLFWALAVVFFPLYHVFPVETSPREALPGTLFAAASWTISAVAFRWYAGLSESVQLYGIVGGALLFLAWLYLAALVILLGVVLNAVLAEKVTPDYEWLPTRLSRSERGQG